MGFKYEKIHICNVFFLKSSCTSKFFDTIQLLRVYACLRNKRIDFAVWGYDI